MPSNPLISPLNRVRSATPSPSHGQIRVISHPTPFTTVWMSTHQRSAFFQLGRFGILKLQLTVGRLAAVGACGSRGMTRPSVQAQAFILVRMHSTPMTGIILTACPNIGLLHPPLTVRGAPVLGRSVTSACLELSQVLGTTPMFKRKTHKAHGAMFGQTRQR